MFLESYHGVYISNKFSITDHNINNDKMGASFTSCSLSYGIYIDGFLFTIDVSHHIHLISGKNVVRSSTHHRSSPGVRILRELSTTTIVPIKYNVLFEDAGLFWVLSTKYLPSIMIQEVLVIVYK